MKGELLLEFEEKWGDDLKYVLHEQDVRELFSDIAKLMDGKSVFAEKKWVQDVRFMKFRKKRKKKVKVPEATIETMIEL